MRCSDGNLYVVKFSNNPQHSRVLANELLATRLAARVGIPVPATAIVDVEASLLARTPGLNIQLAHGTVPCEKGLQFGSRYVVNPLQGQVYDYLPAEMLGRVLNLETFAGMLVLDKWTGNTDGRQVAFWRWSRERKYRVSFIDQGCCFNAGEWTFPDDPLRGVYAQHEVYAEIRGWKSFEPWLSKIEDMDEDFLWSTAESIPREWYGEARGDLDRLVHTLILRRRIVRELIEAFGTSPRCPFPKWTQRATAMVFYKA